MSGTDAITVWIGLGVIVALSILTALIIAARHAWIEVLDDLDREQANGPCGAVEGWVNHDHSHSTTSGAQRDHG